MKNKILNLISGLNLISFFAAATGVESTPIAAFVICGVNLTWLLLFQYANREAY